MKQFKGTPGPWINTYSTAIFANNIYVAEVMSVDEPIEVQRANTRLIVTAPELLEALKNFEVAVNTVKYCQEKRPKNLWSALELLDQRTTEARAIINKALGELQ